jgi:hypothetical protein
MIRVIWIVSCVAFLAAATAEGSGVAAESRPYSLKASVRCVTQAGGKVGLVRRTDSRRIALSDLAQRTSREARFGSGSVLLAFTRGTSEADILREALIVPTDPYLLRVKSNVVLMYRPGAVSAFSKTLRCLRFG